MNNLERKGLPKLNERYFKLDVQEYTVYVEGDIDKLFWEQVFPKDDTWKPNIEVLKKEDGSVIGGWRNLLNYLEEHIKNKVSINYIVAIDGDYNAILNHKYLYENMVITKKYNIENYLFCPKSLNKCMKNLSLGVFDNEEIINNTVKKFSQMIKVLIIIDCINERDQLGIINYGLQEKDLQTFLTLKNYINKFRLNYSEILNKNIDIMKDYNLIDYVRWKCFLKQLNTILGNIVNQYINKENNTRKNNTIRRTNKLRVEEGLYMYCIDNCKLCTENCDDYNNIKEQAKKAYEKIKINTMAISTSHS